MTDVWLRLIFAAGRMKDSGTGAHPLKGKSMFIRVTAQRVRPEDRELYVRTFVEEAKQVHLTEPDNANYYFLKDVNDENNFIFVAAFKDRAAFESHLLAPHFRNYKDTFAAKGVKAETMVYWECENISPSDSFFLSLKQADFVPR